MLSLTIVSPSWAELGLDVSQGTNPSHISRSPNGNPEALQQLFAASLDPNLATALEPEMLLLEASNPLNPGSLWPIRTYLLGETLLLRGDKTGARKAFRSLVSWANTDPGKDGWGGSSLAAPALWRWAQLAEADPSTSNDEITQILQRADGLLATRFTMQLFRYRGLALMPHLQEDILRFLVFLDARLPEDQSSQRRLVSYLEVARNAKLEPGIQKLVEEMVARQEFDWDRINLIRGKRFYELREYELAVDSLKAASKSDDLQLASEASYHLARVLSRQGARTHRTEIISRLEDVLRDNQDPEIYQRALYDLAITRNRSGKDYDPEGFRRDLERLVSEYPEGFRSDNALYQLAMAYSRNGNIEKSLLTFKRLRDFKGKNDWIETAHFRPALIRYLRKEPTELEKAVVLLEELVERIPNGDLTNAGYFWAGRISAELGEPGRAEKHFQYLVEKNLFRYYGLRAKLHLQYGTEASSIRHIDPKMRREIAVRRRSHTPGPLRPLSIYHQRLHQVLETGLYKAALAERKRLRNAFPSRRLEQIGMRELNDAHLVPQASLLLALRQVAYAAKDSIPDSRNRLEVAYAVGRDSTDPELAMAMIFAVGETGKVAKGSAIMDEPGYLVAAYPEKYREAILDSCKKYHIPPHLAYAIMRHESYLYHAALSPVGALGLFQFMPRVFDNLDRDWDLLRRSGMPSREAFLMDPDSNIGLWTRWFRQRLLRRYKNDGENQHFFAVVAHQAGMGNLRKWREKWAKDGVEEKDLELMIEFIPFGATRSFLREVLSSWEISEAVGLLGVEK